MQLKGWDQNKAIELNGIWKNLIDQKSLGRKQQKKKTRKKL